MFLGGPGSQYEETPAAGGQDVNDDLSGPHQYLKNQIAAAKKKKRNVAFYFSDENLHKTTDEMQREWDQKREDNQFMQRLNWGLREFGSIEAMPPELFGKPYEELQAMIGKMPTRPDLVQPGAPTTGQALAGLVVGLLNPQFAFDAAAAPYQVQARRADMTNAQNMQAYEDQLKKFQLQFGISREKAGVIVQAQQDQQRMKFQAQEADLGRLFNARLTEFQARHDWDLFVAGEQSSFMKMDRQMQNAMAGRALDAAFSETGGPGYRAAAAALLEGLTGKKFETLQQMTPAERDQEVMTKLREFQLQSGKEMFPIEKNKALLENTILGITAKYLPAEKQAEIANIYSSIEARTAAAAQGWAGLDLQKQQIGQSNGALDKALYEAGEAASERERSLRTDKSKLEAAIRAEMEKNGEFVKPGDGGHWWTGGLTGGKTKEQAAAENEKRFQAKLESDPEWQNYRDQLAEVQDEKKQIEAERKSRASGASSAGTVGDNPVARGGLGRKYMPGGSNPQRYSMSQRGSSNFTDCSEFTQCVYRDAGIQIPATAQTQFDASVPVNQMQMQPGDLVFFQDTKPSSGRKGLRVHHVGVFIGYNDKGRPIMRHASAAKDRIVEVDLQEYSAGGRMRLLGVRRPTAVK